MVKVVKNNKSISFFLVALFLVVVGVLVFFSFKKDKEYSNFYNNEFFDIEYKVNNNYKEIISQNQNSKEQLNIFSSGEIILDSNQSVELFQNKFYDVNIQISFDRGEFYLMEYYTDFLFNNLYKTSLKLHNVQLLIQIKNDSNIEWINISTDFIYHGLNFFNYIDDVVSYNGSISIYGFETGTKIFLLNNEIIEQYYSEKLCRYYGLSYDSINNQIYKENYWDMIYNDIK